MAWVDVKNTQQNDARASSGGVSSTGGVRIYSTGAPWWMLGAVALAALWVWKGR